AQRCKCLPDFRSARGLGLLEAVIDGYGHTLRRFFLECDNLSASGQILSAQSLVRLRSLRSIFFPGFLVDDFRLRDDVTFWLGLGMKSMSAHSANRYASDESDYHLVIGIHNPLR